MVSHQAWQEEAHCRSHTLDWFFPAEGEQGEAREQRESAARAVCRACPVREPCLDMALSLEVQHGVWGGLNERERRRIRRQPALPQPCRGPAA